MLCGRVRDAGDGERLGGGEPVVCGGEYVASVEDGDAAALEDVERPEPRLDPVERRQDVEAAESDVARLEPGDGLGGRQDRAEPSTGGRGAARDDGEGGHRPRMFGRARSQGKGRWPGRCRTDPSL